MKEARRRRLTCVVVGVVGALLGAPGAAQQGPDPFRESRSSWGQPGVDQWALDAMGWAATSAGTRVTVAVLDSGIDWLHPDLPRDRLAWNDADPPNGVDDDRNGFVDDQMGWDFVEARPLPWDDVGHGTHVAGLIAAATGNGIGIAGVSPAARVLPLRVIGASGQGRASHLVAALDYAVQQGARVINLSLGGEGFTPAEREALARASAKAVVVVAAGNRNESVAPGLENVPGLVVVTALGRDGGRAPFSNLGAAVSLAAPGVDVISLRARGTDFVALSGGGSAPGASFVALPGDGPAYQRASGTSFAAALVSGAAATLLAERGDLSPAEVVRLLQQSARDVEPEGVDQLTGFGALDLAAARTADPAVFVDAMIRRIELAPGGQVFRVVGRASADRFGEATLTLSPRGHEVDEDEHESAPIDRTLPVAGPVEDGVLLRLDRAALADAPEWLLTLRVTHQDGRTRSASTLFAAAEPAQATDAQAAAAGESWPAMRPRVSAGSGGTAPPDALVLEGRLDLPEGNRSLLRLSDVDDPAAWAREQGLPRDQVHRLGGDRAVASVPDGAPACSTGNCEPDPCRTYLSEFSLSGEAPSDAKLRLVRSTPRLPGAGDRPALADGAVAPGALQCEPGGFEDTFGEAQRADAQGRFALQLAQAGEPDRGCLDLIADAQCTPSRMPVRDLAPELEPGRIVALVPRDAAGIGAALATAAGLTLLDAEPLVAIDRVLLRFAVPEGGPTMQLALDALGSDVRIELAHQERRYRTTGVYSDPLGPLSYGPEQIGAVRLHAAATGAGVLVAVIDSGVDAAHPELAGRIVGSHDTTGYGPSADRHGTAVAGLIAGQPDNGSGAWGAAPGAEILAIKACQAATARDLAARCWSATLAKAIDLALVHEARVINLSLAGPPDPVVERMVAAAVAKGALVVAASGNGGPNAKPGYPAALESVLAVTAIDSEARLYERATRGSFVDVAAPGVEVVSPAPGDDYPVLSGTSFATAFVSGAAALLLELQGEGGSDPIRAALEGTSQDLGEPGPDALFGRGQIDLCQAASSLRPETPTCP